MTDRPQYRFTKQDRLLQAAAFGRVFKKPTRSRDKWFTVLSRLNGTPRARLGLAVSKKHCRHATGRNRIKRVIRESFRQHQSQLAGLDIVVMSQPQTNLASNRVLFESLERHWNKSTQRQGAQE